MTTAVNCSLINVRSLINIHFLINNHSLINIPSPVSTCNVPIIPTLTTDSPPSQHNFLSTTSMNKAPSLTLMKNNNPSTDTSLFLQKITDSTPNMIMNNAGNTLFHQYTDHHFLHSPSMTPRNSYHYSTTTSPHFSPRQLTTFKRN